MKKHPIRILLLLLACILCLGAVSCKKDPVEPPPEEDTGIPLVQDGTALYRIVRPDAADAKSEAVAAAVLLRKAIKTVTGVEPDLITDWTDKDTNDGIPEILIGATNRAASQVLSDLNGDEYAIRADGNKIVIAAGSDNLLKTAVTQFLLNYVGYISEDKYEEKAMISIPKNLDVRETWEYRGKAVLLKASDAATYDEALASVLEQSGIDLIRADFSTMSVKEIFSKSTADLVIFEDARRLPGGAADQIVKFLKDGGRLLTLGGPAFSEQVYEYEGKWLTRSEYMTEYIKDLGEEQFFRFLDTSDEQAVSKLGRSTNTPKNVTERFVDDFGLEGYEAELCVDVSNLDSWDLIRSDFHVTGSGLNALGFFASGDAETGTDSLYVEIQETDNTRWYTVVTLSDRWEYCSVTESDFTWWDGDASKKGGKPVFDNVKACSFGFALSGRSVPLGHHVYYLADPAFLRLDDDFPMAEIPAIDCLTPEYEVYPVTNAAKLTVYGEDTQSFLTPKELTVPSEIISCSPGRQGRGYNDNRISRFIPLIEITDEKGLHSGYAAWINVFSGNTDHNGSLEGAVIGSFSAVSADFYNAAGLSAVAEAAKALLHPAFLVEGGMTENIYVAADTEAVTYGGSYIDSAKSGAEATVTVTLLDADGKELAKTEASGKDLKALKNGIQTVSSTYRVEGGVPAKAVTTLTVNGQEIDRIVHPVKFWVPKPEAERKYITVENGYFRQDGKLMNFFGVNYMPSSGVAEQVGTNFEHYVSDPAYDPEVIHNDLMHVKDIGYNAVSIFVYVQAIRETNNVLDLIDQCGELGLYVDLSIRPDAYPMQGFVDNDVKDLITRLPFSQIDNIIAYDIAWEPQLKANTDGSLRAGWESDWNAWIKAQYGSVAHAEELWGVKSTQVTDAMLESTDQKNTAIVAAYRRFVDDQVARIFNQKMPFMRSLDPNHLFSFRMSMAGSATVSPSSYCYDFQSLTSSVDFMSPEGYAINPNDDSALQIYFCNAYARYTNPDKPVVWKEYGRHVWTGSNFGNHASALKAQEDYYRYFLEYAYNSYSSALYSWFFPGGYRINERSDYGILNPDGSDRPATKLMREYAPKFIGQGERKAADVLLTVERDDYPSSIMGMFNHLKSRMTDAYRKGQMIALVNEEQKTENAGFYASAVLDQAVGGTKAEGQFPLRYVNGQILSVETANGKTVVTFVNTGHAIWDKGAVSLITADGKKVLAAIDEEIPYLGTGSVTFDGDMKGQTLRFRIENIDFGNPYQVK